MRHLPLQSRRSRPGHDVDFWFLEGGALVGRQQLNSACLAPAEFAAPRDILNTP